MGKPQNLGHLAHIVAYDTENHITVPAGITMHTNQLVASQAWVTTALGSYALSSSLGSYVPTSRTITINGTVYDLSENREWNITSMIYPAAGIALSTGTAWGTSITNNSANWNTAYGWGNHASAGYLTGITSTQVTTALGYTPYNGTTNPNGYITGISFANVSAKPTTLAGYGITDAVPSSRTITINGTALDLSANRSWTVSASDATKLPLSGGTMTGKIYTVSTGTGTYETAIEIRETSYVTTSQSAWGYSPALTFHWGGRYAKRFGMRSDGLFAVDDEPLALRSWVTSQGYITGSYLPLSGGTVTGDIVYSNLKFSGDQTYGLIGRNAYVDTINGRGSDPLEINYYDGGHVIIGTGSTGSKALYAGSLYDSGNRVITTSSIGSQSVSYASSANYANHLPTHYVGGAQGNPQVYFNNGIGLKAAMTGAWSVWSDTLWVNGYSGGDVPWMCALHFLRNSEPRFAISAQTHTGTGYGSYYEVITAYNIASQSVSYASTSGNTNGSSTSVELTGGNYIWFNGSGYHNVRMYESYGIVMNMISHPWNVSILNGSLLTGLQATGGNYGIGNGYFTGDVTAYYSDKRLKHNLKKIDNALSKVMSLTGYTYQHNELGQELLKENPHKVHAGYVAQEVQSVLPEVVTIAPFDLDGYDEFGKGISRSGNNYLTIKYERILPLVTEAIKEQQKRIDAQDAIIEELKELVYGLTK